VSQVRVLSPLLPAAGRHPLSSSTTAKRTGDRRLTPRSARAYALTVAEVALPDLPVLTEVERSCLRRYLELLVDSLGDNLDEVVLFGSVARGEAWPRGMRIRSDVDLLVLVHAPLSDALSAELIDATLPLFLECGRQMGPVFRTREQLDAQSERHPVFLENLARDAVCVYRSPSPRRRPVSRSGFGPARVSCCGGAG
jgi:predicted nucleotidyltransferase